MPANFASAAGALNTAAAISTARSLPTLATAAYSNAAIHADIDVDFLSLAMLPTQVAQLQLGLQTAAATITPKTPAPRSTKH
ncbi:hypothetical protein H2203_009027 [Taxawa tesnikishii (nom. ined.)]|nr:hypothetical protein H2203_009027 [Dothideales sp. JES 119]